MTTPGAPAEAGTQDLEDAKIIKLARTARQRAYLLAGSGLERAEGAAVRDTDGRTYAAATVEHPDASLSTSALQGALSAAYSSGARTFEAVALVAAEPALSERDRRIVDGLAPGIGVLLADPAGTTVADGR